MHEPRPPQTYRRIVFVTALCCLMFEIVLARLADYHLGADQTFLALPIAFLGLALGSLHMHLSGKALERFRVERELVVLACTTIGGLVFALVFFGWLMPVTSQLGMMGRLDYLARKTAIFIVLMTTPFYVFGRILTGIYHLRREDIAGIYASDFIGAALACALTPVAFHLGGLPYVTFPLTLIAFAPLVLITPPGRRQQLLALLALLVSLGTARFVAWADDNVSYENYREDAIVEELEHGWSEHSRVALIKRRFFRDDGSLTKPNYKIIHNNSRSNVRLARYKGKRKTPREPKRLEAIEAAFVLGRTPDNILAMFAGTGAQMVAFDQYAGSKIPITGVELNGVVEKLGRQNEDIAFMRLHEFLSREDINLVIDEGRHFLASQAEGTTYDLIYLGCAASTTAVTGHSRKYLDTTEALDKYLDLLSDEGLFIIDQQPLDRHLHNLIEVFERRGLGDIRDKIMIVDSKEGNDDLIVSPSGFAAEELERVEAFAKQRWKRKWQRKVVYLPGRDNPRAKKHLEAIEHPLPPVTDDKPFRRRVEFDNYTLVPSEEQKSSHRWYVSWIKVTTVAVLISVALLFIGVASIKRDSRAPLPVLLYLLMTGFCFMLIEVTLMAKMELFLAEPLLSMAAVLSLFLLTSGLGSMLYDRIADYLDTRWLALAAAALAPLVSWVLDLLAAHALGVEVWLKLLLTALVVAPLGMVLGLFFPHIISCLLANERQQTVAISYGISTLASVVGSAYALVLMINVGFSGLIFQAVGVYLALFAFAQVYKLLGGRWLSR